MYAALASLALLFVSPVCASIYITNPVQPTTCGGGGSCTVQWVDNGVQPLLSQIGECTVGLYTGDYVLVQSLPSTDVSTTSSLSFTPSTDAGPNGQYYIVFTSINYSGYQAFSASFALTGMSGSIPSGGSSTPAPASTDSSASAASSNPVPSPTGTGADTDTASATGTSTPVVGTTTPTDTNSATAATGTPTLTTAIATIPVTTTTTPSKITTTTTTSKTSTSATPSASTTTNAAGRVGSSTSLGGIAALLALSGILAF